MGPVSSVAWPWRERQRWRGRAVAGGAPAVPVGRGTPAVPDGMKEGTTGGGRGGRGRKGSPAVRAGIG